MAAVTMIDLSFLTEEEQETILTVLKRDAELKKAEEQRVQNLQKTVSDKGQLKYLTGEWFYETKQLRHQDRVHGSDIIRASMRHSHKPLTILELSRILPEKSSFVISENKEVFVPPVLCGLLQEPQLQLCNERYQNKNLYETPQETPKSVLQSPTKRKNPFNRELNASHTFKEMNSQLLDGAVDQSQKLNEDVSEKCNSELLSPAVSSLLSSEQKSDPLYLETETKEDHHSQAGATDGLTRHNICQQKLPEQSSGISVKVTRPLTSGSSKCSFQAVSPQPRQRLLGIFTREEERSAELHSLQEKEVKIQQEEPGKSQNLPLGTVDMTVGKHASVKNETKFSEMREFRTLTALENTTFKETVTTMDADCQQDATEGRAVEFPERLSNLKAFWEKKKTGPKIDFIREEARQEDIPKTGVEVSHGPQTYMERMNNLSVRREMTFEDTTGRSQAEISSPQTEFSLFVDLSKGDGTYRANPVLIYEETDDSLTGSLTESQISKSQKNNVTPVPSSVTFNAQESLLRHTISGPQEDKPTGITDHFLEIEHTGPKIIPARVKEAPRSSLLINKVVSPQSYLRTSLDKREKSKGEAQTSPYKTKPNVVSKSLKLTDKCFVSQSPDGSQLRSSSGTGDAQSTCQQYEVKERPFSPSKSQRQRSKDQDEEVRRSPSKTCHPRVLPKESFSPKRSRLEGSLLKTFPIDIKPETKEVEEQQGQLTPVARQRKSPSHAAKQTALADSKPSTDITSCLLHLHLEEREAYFGHLNTQPNNSRSTSPQSINASEKKLGTFKCLGRSFISQDCQHYLGPQENAYFPPFHHEKCVAEENDVIYGPCAFRKIVGDQSDSPTESNHPRICSWIVEKKDGTSSQDTTTRAWFMSWASSGSYDESSSPIMSALKQLPSRSMSSSKSLENFTSQTREERTKTNQREQIRLSVDDVSSLPTSASTLSNSKQIKSSVSVPVLQQDETDSDSTFKTYLGWRRNTGSSTSNISLSSGMVSMSSVSGSISSNNTIDFGDIEVQGSIQFAVNYIQKLGEFHIFVVHCRELAMARTKKNRSDPYVKCYLLPDKTKLGKRKTTVKKKTLNPTYNEILRFKVIMEVLKTQNLNISVWHNESFGQNSFLGEVELDLSEWDFSNTQINEYALKARVSAHTSVLFPSHLMDSRGQMRVALRFLPQTSHGKRATRMETGEVQIWVKDCKNLPSVREVIIDPFVKSMVLPDTSRKSRQKTRVVKRTANPMFNHTMVYDGFRKEDLREACVEITVWDHDRLKSLYIGGLRLGLGTGKSYGVEVDWMDSTRDETNLWQRMLQSDHEWVEDVLPLRMFVMAKNMSK